MNFILCGRKSAPLYTSESHTHNAWEIVLNHQGECTSEIGSKSFHLNDRAIVCIPPQVAHSKSSEKGFCDIFVQCKSLSLPNNGEAIIVHDDEEKSVNSLLHILHRVYRKRENGYRESCESLFLAIEQIITSRAGQSEKDPLVMHIIDSMIDQFDDPDFSLASLIEKSGYCDDHLRRKFQKNTGMSMLEYLTDLRINSAKKLLRENDRLRYSVSQISTMSGFSDIGYFSRVFRKKTGLSPSEYIKKHSKLQ